ncbi:hypothetical protein LFT45_01545 [Arthrobacter sp. FW305-BF8]|uniref:immunoglobulin-like domain-containing protein n=1 Tax=Arthrobacter sp. FW305-BF8 TaxID=2879617 RepID=UPI001F3EC15D|nr:immunoglobulin-like domain-containing protein [Arthrobacter sp. FW305-BF8]UKA54670.1 hypothetical protein LFT45_01545 [Arthrobacter sp. FW305-BF8]
MTVTPSCARNALSADEVRELGYVSPEQRVALDLQDLSLWDTSAVTANLKLPLTGPNGSAYAWSSSDPATVSTQGAVTCPGHGTRAPRHGTVLPVTKAELDRLHAQL